MKSRKNQSGLSLVEMMIAAAIVSVLAVGFSAYMSNVTKQQKGVQQTMDIMQLNAQLNAAAIDPMSIYQSAQQGITTTTTTTTTGSGLPQGQNAGHTASGYKNLYQ